MIFCFSGTGNTKSVAEHLSRHLNERIIMIGGDNSTAYRLNPGEKVIWMFPVHSWGVPPVVRRFIRSVQIELDERSRHYMVCTCGDDIGLAHEMWRREVKRRGWRAVAAHSVTMPNSYVLLPGFDVDSADVEQAKLYAMPERVARVAHAIKCASPIDDVMKGKCAWLKTKVIYPFFMRFMMSPKPLHSTPKCVGCGTCAKMCPLGNIVMNDRMPCWGSDCALCLSCYHNCPHHAVSYGNKTSKKGQYKMH